MQNNIGDNMTLKTEKIAGIIQKEVSEIIQFQLKDPKIGFITITDVVVSGDLSIAKVYVSFLGQKAREAAGMKALERSKGFIRSELAKRMTIRKVPSLVFLIDDSLEKGNKIENIIKEIIIITTTVMTVVSKFGNGSKLLATNC